MVVFEQTHADHGIVLYVTTLRQVDIELCYATRLDQKSGTPSLSNP